MRWATAVFLLANLAGVFPAAAEDLLKPVGGPGAGASVEGLQASARAVKEDFGPGESVLIHWTLANGGARDRVLNLDKDRRSFSLFGFEARRDGQPVSLARQAAEGARPAGVQKVLAAGAKLDLWVDLRGLDWTDRKWLDPRGVYEVCVIYRGADVGREIRSGWAGFKVAAPGSSVAVQLDPKEAEEIKSLIADLGAEDFEKREAAQARLLEFGEKALGPLMEAITTTEDPEIRLRCQQTIDRINQMRRHRHLAGPLCRECADKAFTADVGQCVNCRGPTPSGSWKYCRECAQRLGRCAACGRLLRQPPPPPPPEPLPPRPQPKPEPQPPQPPPPPPPLPPDDF
jgi:hypothetical protein